MLRPFAPDAICAGASQHTQIGRCCEGARIELPLVRGAVRFMAAHASFADAHESAESGDRIRREMTPDENPRPADAQPGPAPAATPASTSASPAPASAAAKSVAPKPLDEFDAMGWEVPLICKDCEKDFKVPYRHFQVGVVFHCPHCHGSFVPKLSMYRSVRDAFETFYAAR